MKTIGVIAHGRKLGNAYGDATTLNTIARLAPGVTWMVAGKHDDLHVDADADVDVLEESHRNDSGRIYSTRKRHGIVCAQCGEPPEPGAQLVLNCCGPGRAAAQRERQHAETAAQLDGLFIILTRGSVAGHPVPSQHRENGWAEGTATTRNLCGYVTTAINRMNNRGGRIVYWSPEPRCVLADRALNNTNGWDRILAGTGYAGRKVRYSTYMVDGEFAEPAPQVYEPWNGIGLESMFDRE